MTAGSIRLRSGLILLSLPAMLFPVLAYTPGINAQDTRPAGATAPAAQDLEGQIQKIVGNLQGMSPNSVLSELEPLLQGDLSGVLTSVKVAGFNALASAHERLAQDLRLNRLDPAAERKAQEELDKAAAAYISGGKAAAADRDFATAEQLYTRALTFRPSEPQALLGIARVYAAPEARKPFQALERFQQYISVTGQDRTVSEPELYVEIGRVYADANLWHQAMKSYRQALANGLDNDELAALLASCHMALGQADEAFKQADKAIAKKSDQPAYYRMYAELLMGRNEFAKACEKVAEGIRVAKERLAKKPDDATTLGVLNECYAVYNRALENVVARNPEDVQTRLTLVRSLQDQTDVIQILALHRALGILRNAPEKDRATVPVLEEQIRLQQAVRHSGLEATCKRLLEIDPQNKTAFETLAALTASQAAAETDAAK